MKNKLKELEDLILFEEHSDVEWDEINESVRKEFEKATEKEREEFMDSGAGDALAQIMEYMD